MLNGGQGMAGLELLREEGGVLVGTCRAWMVAAFLAPHRRADYPDTKQTERTYYFPHPVAQQVRLEAKYGRHRN